MRLIRGSKAHETNVASRQMHPLKSEVFGERNGIFRCKRMIGKYLQKYVGTHMKAMGKALGNFFADRAFSAQDVRDPALWRAVAQVFLYSVCVSTARMNILWRL